MDSISSYFDSEATIYCCMYAGCGNEYFSKYNLKRHVESVHQKVKKFKCSICEVLFSSKQSLREHYFKHQGAMPLKCLSCNKSFRQASLLSLHKRIHNSEGTASVIIKAELDEINFEYLKVESKTEELAIKLPMIHGSRQGAGLLPFPNLPFSEKFNLYD